MAYTIPVVALLFDEAAAAAAINEPPDYFENQNIDRWAGVEALAKLTSAPVENFSDENQEFFYVGIRVDSDWRILIDSALASKAAAVKAAYPHPLVQETQLAVVSEFC